MEFALKYRGNTIAKFESTELEYEDWKALQHLNRSGKHLVFGPVNKGQTIPPMDHDALDDIALEQVGGGYCPHDLKGQAERRIAQRGLQR
jgi:hypothetical protein